MSKTDFFLKNFINIRNFSKLKEIHKVSLFEILSRFLQDLNSTQY